MERFPRQKTGSWERQPGEPEDKPCNIAVQFVMRNLKYHLSTGTQSNYL